MKKSRVVRSYRRLTSLLTVLNLCLLPGLPARAVNVTLGWNPVVATNFWGYHLYYGNTSGGNYTNRVYTGTNTTLTVSGLATNLTYYFAVTSCNLAGTESALSNQAMFNTSSNTPPVITIQPVSQTNVLGTRAIFRVGATGMSLTYLWKRSGTIIPSATTSQLTIPQVQTFNNTSYTVTVSNSAGSVISVPAILTVLATNTPALSMMAIAPAPLFLTPAANLDGSLSIQFSVSPGYGYELQTTTDWQSWTTLWQTNTVSATAQIAFNDTAASGSSMKFYRMVIH